jgi:hypothetical protein
VWYPSRRFDPIGRVAFSLSLFVTYGVGLIMSLQVEFGDLLLDCWYEIDWACCSNTSKATSS